MTTQFYIGAYTKENTALALTKRGNWCSAYVAFNDYLWRLFDSKDAAEAEAQAIKTRLPADTIIDVSTIRPLEY